MAPWGSSWSDVVALCFVAFVCALLVVAWAACGLAVGDVVWCSTEFGGGDVVGYACSACAAWVLDAAAVVVTL